MYQYYAQDTVAMIYKFYLNKYFNPPPPERREFFNKLYQEHGVELIGVFRNKDDPLELIMITGYRDEGHYEEFVSAVKENSKYRELTKQIEEVRVSNEMKTLEKI